MTDSVVPPRLTGVSSIRLAAQALRMWSFRQLLVAALAAVVVALIIGVATVLIPNPVFGRDIPPVWWNYPVWLLTSALSGMLIATYIRTSNVHEPDSDAAATGESADVESQEESSARRTSRMGLAGGILAWFAVGCPVCNKLALMALGYSGAITWFTPVQPFLALAAMILTGVAVLWRLRGQVACPVTLPEAATVS